MRLLDRLTGTRYPSGGVAPRSSAEVRAALLALGAPDAPYRVRTATAAEKADLVAEWRNPGPGEYLRTRLRLIPARREVRALDEHRDARTREYSRGQVTRFSRTWTLDRGAEGCLRMTETSRFDLAEMRDPLRTAVLDAGWTWRGALLKL
ncbi:hypothetical protein [Streptomyces sp. NPDC006307]|uniref:hypothetical protein n=1 Tax=Streptomyces sp. NPDC006307 TaxID=3156748 RepID=UPI0033A4B561